MFRARFEVLEQCDFIWLPNTGSRHLQTRFVLEQCDFIWLPNINLHYTVLNHVLDSVISYGDQRTLPEFAFGAEVTRGIFAGERDIFIRDEDGM